MLKRNARSIVTWEYRASQQLLDRPNIVNNGIWDLICISLPEYNIVIMGKHERLFPGVGTLLPMACKGKPAVASIARLWSIPPCPIFEDVKTGVLSYDYDVHISSNPNADVRVEVYNVFPMYDDIISLDELIHLRTQTEAFHIERYRKCIKKLTDLSPSKLSDLFNICLNTLLRLSKLNLNNDDWKAWGFYFAFQATGTGGSEVEVLLDPLYYTFNNTFPGIDEFVHQCKELIPTLRFEEVKNTEDIGILHYDLPEWKAKNTSEENKVSEMLLAWFNLDATADEKQDVSVIYFRRTLDSLMWLICWGHAEEIYDAMQKPITIYEVIRVTLITCLKYYKQHPYDRISLELLFDMQGSDSTEVFNMNEPSEYLINPNAYRQKYLAMRDLSSTRTKKIQPSTVPQDSHHFLNDIFGVSSEDIARELKHKPDEYPLQVSPIKFKRVKVNGIEFESSDLRLFYNTQFYDLVSSLTNSGEQDISISYISIADLKVIKDFLMGRLMPQAFRQELSPQGTIFLGGDRTFWQLTTVSETLFTFNFIFNLGERFVDHLRLAEFTSNERWNELLEIIR